jgi:hypothetical protein
MTGRATTIGRYALVGAAGALGGGLLVARLTDAMPRLVTAMMEAMHAKMAAAGIDPAEM